MTTTVEARGVLCPVPIIRLARAAAQLPPGSLIELLSDDPATEHDVPAWCRLRGHELLSVEPLPSVPPSDDVHETPPHTGGSIHIAEKAGDGEPPPSHDVYDTPRQTDGSIHIVGEAEPHVPNPSPGQGLRHLIRLGWTASPGSPEPSKGRAGALGSPGSAELSQG